jgi:hypothetical protein
MILNAVPLPTDYETLRPYFDLIRHVRSIVVRGSLQWVEVGMFIDQDGNPQLWGAIERHTLYPRSREIDVVKIHE